MGNRWLFSNGVLYHQYKDTFSPFKRELQRRMFPTTNLPATCMHGNRLLPIIHTQLCKKCSDLKRDLFTNHLFNHGICSHSKIPQTAHHYVFLCKMYSKDLHSPLHPLNSYVLLFGKYDCSQCMHEFYLEHDRFTPQLFMVMFVLFRVGFVLCFVLCLFCFVLCLCLFCF